MTNIKELFRMQASLDRYIEESQELENEQLLERKLMAFQVELAELANETRCFKFWSNKGPSERQVILEEYVDGVHFLLSVGLERGLENTVTVRAGGECRKENSQLVDDFFLVMEDILSFREEGSSEKYEILFNRYLQLGEHLGFSAEEIEKAYMDKNEVNRQRQDDGY